MEKLMKSINSLKFFYGRSSITEKIDKDLEPKERQNHCNAIIDLLITSQAVKTVPEFQSLLGLSTEVLLQSCADENADVRLTANDCINTLVKTISTSNIHKILVELFKEIRKNSSARSLKVALDRFSHLCVNIRPSKCRPFLLNLLPCLARVSSREEDTIQECLNASMKNIFRILGSFVNEHELQTLVVSFLKNLSSESQVKRRVAGSCLQIVVENSRNSFLFLRSLLCSIRDILLQRLNDRCTAIGCLHAFRQLVPLLSTCEDAENNDIEDDVFMVFSMALYFTTNTDHTIVTSSLELIEQIFTSYSWEMSRMLATHQPFKTKFNLYSAMKKVLTPNAGRKQQRHTEEKSNNNKQQQDEIQEETEKCLNHLLDRIVNNLHEDSGSDNISIHSNLSYDMRDTPISGNVTAGGCLDIISLDHFFPNANRTNQENPLLLLAKLLCQKFLLTPIKGKMISSSEVRVSNKSLALNCLEQIVKIHPEYLLENLYGNQQPQPNANGDMTTTSPVKLCDVTLYAQHVDPKLRGSAVKLMARYLKSSTNSSNNNRNKRSGGKVENLQTSYIIHLIRTSLKDESPITNRHACVAINTCIDVLLDSDNYIQGLDVLNDLLLLLNKSNYWLLIVEILACVSNLNFRRIHLLEMYLGRTNQKIGSLQPKVMEIVLNFLSNDDIRIRTSASSTLCSLVSNLVSHEHSAVTVVAREAIFRSKHVLSIHEKEDVVDGDQLKSLLKPYRGYHINDVGGDDLSYSSSLSTIIQSIWTKLATSTSKYQTSGCVQALKTLAQQFPINSYLSSWQCHFYTALPPPTGTGGSFTQSSQRARHVVHELRQMRKELQQLPGILPYIFDLLKSSWVILDFNIHSDALLLAGDLLAASVHAEFKTFGVSEKDAIPDKGYISKISNTVLSKYAREIYTHLVKMLSVVHHVIIGVTPTLPNKGVLPNLTVQTSLKKQDSSSTSNTSVVTQKISPLQRSSSNKDDSDKDKSVKIGNFASNRNLMKLHSQLLGAYSGYKRNMNYGKDDKFCSFTNTVLDVFNQILEMTVFEDISENTDEILSYLASTFDVEPTFTIQCVHQLLKSLFGTNLVNHLQQEHGENPKQNTTTSNLMDYSGSLYHQLFHHPIDRFTISIANSSFHNSLTIAQPEKDGWFGSIKKKVEKKLQQVSKTTKNNKVSIQNYIRLFETIVIKSLKHYTSSNDTRLQTSVVDLLSQLVQLRVNYCMLDSDQVFIKFIIKQFESIENGLVRGSQHLIPHVFFFLVLLSYERYHTRCVITMPKIIQLCDGLNAGGQDALTHVIPALEPVIYDLFIFRTTTTRQNDQEISTQREVLQFTILKLLHYPQSFEMLACMLRHYRQEDNEKWKRFSRQVVDVILPLLDQLKVEIECEEHLQLLHSVMRLLASSSLKPVELLLRIMFDVPHQLTCISLLHRWLGKFLTLLRLLICQISEVELYTSLPHTMPKIQAFTKDIHLPHGVVLNRLPTEVTNSKDVTVFLSRYFNQVTLMTARVLLEVCSKQDRMVTDENNFLAQLLAELLLSRSYVHRSGKLKNLTRVVKTMDIEENLQVFNKLVDFYPSVTLLWVQYLTSIGMVDTKIWKTFTKCGADVKELSMNEQIFRNGSIILLTDYICRYKERSDLIEWLLRHHLRHLLQLMEEPPVQDFLIQSLHENIELLIREIPKLFNHSTTNDIGLVQKLVKVTSKCNSPQLLLLFITGSEDFIFSPYLSISDVCDRKLCQIVEHQISLVNNNKTQQQQQIGVVQLQRVMDKMEEEKERFPRLCSLLSKLKRLIIKETANEKDDSKMKQHISMGNEEFFNSMLKLSCSGESLSPQLATMLTFADDDVIKEIVHSKDFKLEFLHSCFETRHIKPVLTISSITEGGKSCLMKSATNLITKLVSEVCDELPEDCEKQRYIADGKQGFPDEMVGLFGKWKHQLFVLCQCVSDVISTRLESSTTMMTSYIRFAFIANEYLIWNLMKVGSIDRHHVDRHHVTSLLKMVNLILNENDELLNNEFLRSLVESSFLLIQQYIGALTSNFPCLPQQFDEDETQHIFDDVTHPLSSCIKLSQLMEIFTFKQQILIPLDVAHSMKILIYQLSSYSLFESYIRIPTSVWKFGWKCDLVELKFPDIPTDYLREVEVLSPYLTILNVIGWRNRTEFEEIWTKFLSILVSQPIHSYSSANPDEVDENSLEVSCLAIRAMTSLMMQCSLQPKVGRPSTCHFQLQHRNCSMKISGTRAGRQLTRVLDLLHDEISTLLDVDPIQIPKHKPPLQTLNSSSDLFYENSESVMKTKSHYNFGQISLQHFRSIHGVLPTYPEDISETSSSDNVNLSVISLPTDDDDDDSDVSDMFEEQLKLQQQQQNNQPPTPVVQSTTMTSQRRANDNDVDVQSCVQFLLDLFGEWIRATTSSGLEPLTSGVTMATTARPFLAECLRSLSLISDLFTEKRQFEWLFNTLSALYNTIYKDDDEILLQHIVSLLCKAAAILGLKVEMVELLLSALERLLSGKFTSSKIVGLHSFLYCLESGKNTESIVSYLSNFLIVTFQSISISDTNNTITDEEFLVISVSTAFYLIYNSRIIVTSYFTSTVLQACVNLVSAGNRTSTRLFHVIMDGFERLVVSYSLSSNFCELIFKCALDNVLINPVTSQCIASVSVMMASMYCGQMRTSDHDSINNEMLDVVETRLLAMERISVLFERIRKGNRMEACVIGKVISLSLRDFVSTQDMLNKTIAEFLSSVQPHPDIIAYVVFEVFQSLHNNDESNLVSEWVLLSLGNSLQRTPLSKAVWCLTLLFATSSNDHFIVSLVPRIVAREKHFGSDEDWQLFCKCAMDFYTSQLNEELDRKSFQSVFTATTVDDDEKSPYKLLLDCIADINGTHGILQ